MNYKYITVHSSATQPLPHITVDTIRGWHVNGNGWSDIGYHYIIESDGSVRTGRPLTQVGAHVKGHNKSNIGICLVGGVDKNGDPVMNYSEKQLQSLHGLVKGLQFIYLIPDSRVKGHRDLSPDLNKDGIIQKREWVKSCPCFDVQHWMKTNEAIFEVT